MAPIGRILRQHAVAAGRRSVALHQTAFGASPRLWQLAARCQVRAFGFDPYSGGREQDPYASRGRGGGRDGDADNWRPPPPRSGSRFGDDYGDDAPGGFRRQGGGGGGREGGYGDRGDRGGGDRGYGGDRDFDRRGSRDAPGGRRDSPGGFSGMPDRMGGVGENLKQVHWQDESLVNLQKDFYSEHPEVSGMSEEEVKAYMLELAANIEGKLPHPRPLKRFEHLSLPSGLMQGVTAHGFAAPTAIQSIGWPAALSGRDMVGIAQTGSGKTLAYILPALVHIAAQPPLRAGDGPVGLVMAPTRELAMQIQSETLKFTHATGIRCTACFGGVSRYGQATDLRRGTELVIATPGRLLDFLESGVTNLKRVTYLVLDEADRMLDMGFEPQIRKIVSQIRPDRQTVMYSATWPKEIQRLSRDFCREDPVKLTIGSEELTSNKDIVQQIEVVEEYEKRDRFMSFMKEVVKDEKVLIFTQTKRGADSLCRELQYAQFSSSAIHGDKDQRQRDRVLNEFRTGRCQILIATDVAQRGLDIKDVKYVINYDMPSNIEDYIHRIGRTGRAGTKGTAVSFFPKDAYKPELIRMARDICKTMHEVGQTPPEELLQFSRGHTTGGGGGGSRPRRGSGRY